MQTIIRRITIKGVDYYLHLCKSIIVLPPTGKKYTFSLKINHFFTQASKFDQIN